MSPALTSLLRRSRVFNPVRRSMIQQRAGYINSKPPKDDIGVKESALVLTVLTVAILGPSGWILSHLDHYRGQS